MPARKPTPARKAGLSLSGYVARRIASDGCTRPVRPYATTWKGR